MQAALIVQFIVRALPAINASSFGADADMLAALNELTSKQTLRTGTFFGPDAADDGFRSFVNQRWDEAQALGYACMTVSRLVAPTPTSAMLKLAADIPPGVAERAASRPGRPGAPEAVLTPQMLALDGALAEVVAGAAEQLKRVYASGAKVELAFACCRAKTAYLSRCPWLPPGQSYHVTLPPVTLLQPADAPAP